MKIRRLDSDAEKVEVDISSVSFLIIKSKYVFKEIKTKFYFEFSWFIAFWKVPTFKSTLY